MSKNRETVPADPVVALARELKIARETIRYLEERTRVIVDSIHTGIVVVDKLTHRIIDVNPEAERLIGAPKDKIVGQRCHRFICHAEIGACPITDKGQTVDSSERILLTADGRSIPILKTVAPISIQGENQLLESFLDISQIKGLQRDLEKRVKELNCLYSITEIIEKTDSIDELIKKAVNRIPPGWYYPKQTCARITLRNKVFETENFQETRWRMVADIAVNGEKVGFVEVGYLEEMPDRDEGPFLKEERNLIDAVAERLSRVIERKQAEEALKASEEQVRLLLNSTAEAIYGIDLDGNCTFVNPACMKMLGYTETEQLLGKNMHEVIHHSYPDGTPMDVEDCRIYKAFREGNGVHVEDEVLWKADGPSFSVEYWSYPQVANGNVTGAVVTFVDISERKRVEERIRYMATHDLLTDLPTLRLAQDRLSVALSAARRNQTKIAVMFMDLDGFKAVNDNLGHDAGDFVLKEVARRISECIRESDTVARVGGDEFLFIAGGLKSRENAGPIAEKIVRSVSAPIDYDGRQASVGISIGIALYPDDGEDMAQLIRISDEAMYRIKNSGKNGYGFVNPCPKGGGIPVIGKVKAAP